MTSGCKDCQDRHIGCHVTCEVYRLFADECRLVRRLNYEYSTVMRSERTLQLMRKRVKK